MAVVHVAALPGTVWYCAHPNVSPLVVRRYRLCSVEVGEDMTLYHLRCEDDPYVHLTHLAEPEFGELMFAREEDAERFMLRIKQDRG